MFLLSLPWLVHVNIHSEFTNGVRWNVLTVLLTAVHSTLWFYFATPGFFVREISRIDWAAPHQATTHASCHMNPDFSHLSCKAMKSHLYFGLMKHLCLCISVPPKKQKKLITILFWTLRTALQLSYDSKNICNWNPLPFFLLHFSFPCQSILRWIRYWFHKSACNSQISAQGKVANHSQ